MLLIHIATSLLLTQAAPPCEPQTWRLQGASVKAIANDATYVDAWTPTLELIAGCAQRDSSQRQCFEVRGHSDEIRWNAAIVGAYGSVQAAQIARAHGRAGSVVSKLFELGMPSHKLRELPPPSQATFRGVEVRLVADCLPPPQVAPAQPSVTEEQLERVTRTRVEGAMDEMARRTAHEIAIGMAARDRKPESPHELWLEAGVDLGVMVTDGPEVFTPTLRIGGGWTNQLVYARLNVGLGAGTTSEQRVGFDASGGAGYYHADWLQLGLTGGTRTGAYTFTTPWLERTWYLGLEGTHCMVAPWETTAELCLHEAFVPLGRVSRRGEIVDATIARIPTQDDLMMSFSVALMLRQDLF